MSILDSFFGLSEPTPSRSVSVMVQEPEIDTPAVTNQVEAAAEAEQPIEVAPYGETFGSLTRFGDQWIPLMQIRWVDFAPLDGCGAEVWVNGDKRAFHLVDEEAAALKQYMTESSLGPRG